MMGLGLLAGLMGLGAEAADCAVHRVAPPDVHALSAAGGVPRNSLVRRSPTASCASGVPVEVLSTDPLYTADPWGGRACVPEVALAPVAGVSWVVPAPWNADDQRPHPQPAGLLLDPLPAVVACDAEALDFGDRTVSLAQLGPLRPIDPDTLRAVLAVQAASIRRFGPVGLSDVLWTHTGRVSLPWVHWETEAELADTFAREALDTADRQERAVRAHGPSEAYLYFKGSDALRSDIWATPAAALALLDAIASWTERCTAAAWGSAVTCAVQLGDLSWYSDRRPDPLGHRDHYAGTCADVRLFRSDGSRYEAWWNRPDDRPGFAESSGYDVVLTGRFIDGLVARPDVDRVLFNDPAVASATPARGHDDHLHVCFEGP